MIHHQIKSYIHYWLEAVDHHSLHSPFLFDFYTKVILSKADRKHVEHLEQVRQHLLNNNQRIVLQGLGSGSKHFSENSRQVKAIAKTSLTSQKFSMLYSSIAQYIDAKTILELGTSLGINAAYLAQKKDAGITTFEGEPEIAKIARTTFTNLNLSNLELIEGDINKTLPLYVSKTEKIELAFLDANHQLVPTLHYFDMIVKKVHSKSVVILDDIHQSKAMEDAWETIKCNPLVYGSIDLYRCGLVFFDPSLNKQHVVLQF